MFWPPCFSGGHALGDRPHGGMEILEQPEPPGIAFTEVRNRGLRLERSYRWRRPDLSVQLGTGDGQWPSASELEGRDMKPGRGTTISFLHDHPPVPAFRSPRPLVGLALLAPPGRRQHDRPQMPSSGLHAFREVNEARPASPGIPAGSPTFLESGNPRCRPSGPRSVFEYEKSDAFRPFLHTIAPP